MQLPLDASLTQQPGAEVESRLPTSLADLASSFEAIKNKGIVQQCVVSVNHTYIKLAASNEDTLYTNRMLDASLQFVPDLIDSER